MVRRHATFDGYESSLPLDRRISLRSGAESGTNKVSCVGVNTVWKGGPTASSEFALILLSYVDGNRSTHDQCCVL